jgi:putative hydrolase, CocE/NonD family
MKKFITLLLLLAGYTVSADTQSDSIWVRQHYTKQERYITMRDGVKLFTAIYAPNDNSEKHPILITRTPYSIAPYGEDTFRAFWKNYTMAYLKQGYIIVYQDVRGRMMSEGEFVDVRPYNDAKKRKEIDEASDTYDTIEWLLKHTHSNKRVGVYGVSYPGFYSTMAALSKHPAVKAVSPQAPVTDWYMGDDFHHNGAFMQMDAFSFYSGFGKKRSGPTKTFSSFYDFPIKDNYQFYLKTATLRNLTALLGDSIAFWKDIVAHPNYDDWWKVRNTRSHVQHIPASTATLVVGGLFDAEDVFGAFNLYKAIEQKAKNDNRIVIGPWAHGGWSRDDGNYLGNIRFGSNTSEWYQQNIEVPYFNYHLKGIGDISKIKEANVFFTGANEWRTFNSWPPAEIKETPLYLHNAGVLTFGEIDVTSYSEYISDPAHPVPYTEDVHQKRTREYMTDDQRFASRRPDVFTYQTDVLTHDLTLAGPVVADLFAAIGSSDADFVVKLIDVFPDDFKYDSTMKGNGRDYLMGGYQMLVRGEVMRGRYRNGFEKPEPFGPNTPNEVKFTMPDVAHVFKKGHRVMVQVQSTWFPLVDRNPQKFVEMYDAIPFDYQKTSIRLFHSKGQTSKIVLPVLN